jgi:outer membrane protein
MNTSGPVLILALLGLSSVAAFAGGPSQVAPEPAVQAPVVTGSENRLSFTLLGGVSVSPDYFGAQDSSVGPNFGISNLGLSWGRAQFGSHDVTTPAPGFDLHGSFRFVSAREASQNAELTGLSDIDASAELGLGVGYTGGFYRAFADVRYGVVGHEGVAGEVGADLFWSASDDLVLSAGPRVQFGNDRFSNTYFGVTAAESGPSGLAAYTAGGGIYGAGVEVGATYRLNADWGLQGSATWTRLQGSAKDSPIVAQGDSDQLGVKLGLTRRITFGF